jgi:hypothetical protein
VAPDVVIAVAAEVTTVGAEAELGVVNERTEPYVSAPTELVATAWK